MIERDDVQQRFPDLPAFVKLVQNTREWHSADEPFFRSGQPVWLARAPGRLDVMGGIADYSGSLVLQLPIAEATYVAFQQADDGLIRVLSLPAREGEAPRCVQRDHAELKQLANSDYGAARLRLRQQADEAWASYVLGVFIVLARERGWIWDGGARLLIRSWVPEAKGVSSSAALEVATMRAVCAALDRPIDGQELARLCQVVENRVVGAPCGIMDQMTSALGRAGQLLALLCQPAEVRGFVPVPPEIELWGLDSGIRHAVSGSDYTAVRTGAFMGYRMIAELAGFSVRDPDEVGEVHFEDTCWGGYLANLSPREFEARFAARLPDSVAGGAFLARYGGISDPVTRVHGDRAYAVRQPTAHPIYEHARVCRYAELLRGQIDDRALEEMGQLMYASHASYSACGLGSDGTDRLVQLVRDGGPADGLYGAKITGGGSGGTVAVLARAGAAEAIHRVAARYQRETGREVFVFSGSSDGADRFPASHWLA